jgi:hypothetical protein
MYRKSALVFPAFRHSAHRMSHNGHAPTCRLEACEIGEFPGRNKRLYARTRTLQLGHESTERAASAAQTARPILPRADLECFPSEAIPGSRQDNALRRRDKPRRWQTASKKRRCVLPADETPVACAVSGPRLYWTTRSACSAPADFIACRMAMMPAGFNPIWLRPLTSVRKLAPRTMAIVPPC